MKGLIILYFNNLQLNTEQVDIIKVWENFRLGDKQSFSLLYETYFDTLYRYGMKFVSDENLVKDSIQDLFIKLYNNRESLSATNSPKFYLLLSLKNLILDTLSRNQRVTYLPANDLPFFATYHYEVNDDSHEIDDEIKKKFDLVISMLNPRQKEALYLRFQLELSYEEISQLLGINYQSARNLIHRSISKIRENIELSAFLLLFIRYYV